MGPLSHYRIPDRSLHAIVWGHSLPRQPTPPGADGPRVSAGAAPAAAAAVPASSAAIAAATAKTVDRLAWLKGAVRSPSSSSSSSYAEGVRAHTHTHARLALSACTGGARPLLLTAPPPPPHTGAGLAAHAVLCAKCPSDLGLCCCSTHTHSQCTPTAPRSPPRGACPLWPGAARAVLPGCVGRAGWSMLGRVSVITNQSSKF